MLKKSGLLTLHRGGETFADLGGLEALKAFCRRALRPGRPRRRPRPRRAPARARPARARARSAKALGNETGRPDAGPRRRRADGLARRPDRASGSARRCGSSTRWPRASSFVDEVEKALAGVAVQRPDRLGVSARLFGTLLTWLNDHESDVFVVCTANDVSKLPPEFSRAERFDAIFFLDLPGPREKERDLADVPRAVRARPRPAAARATATGPAPRSRPAAGWRPCSTSRWSRRRRTSCRWPSRRASRSSGCGTGPPAGACRPTGPASTRGVADRRGKAGRNVHRGDPSAN